MTEHEHRDGQDCADFLERIVYFIDNELDEADCSAVRMHLDECGPCLQKYDLERTVKAVVARSCHESAPEALRSKVLLQLREVHIQIRES